MQSSIRNWFGIIFLAGLTAACSTGVDISRLSGGYTSDLKGDCQINKILFSADSVREVRGGNVAWSYDFDYFALYEHASDRKKVSAVGMFENAGHTFIAVLNPEPLVPPKIVRDTSESLNLPYSFFAVYTAYQHTGMQSDDIANFLNENAPVLSTFVFPCPDKFN